MFNFTFYHELPFSVDENRKLLLPRIVPTFKIEKYFFKGICSHLEDINNLTIKVEISPYNQSLKPAIGRCSTV